MIKYFVIKCRYKRTIIILHAANTFFWQFQYSKNTQCCSSSWIPLIQKWLRMTEERTKERNILFLQNWSVIIDISQSNFQKSFNTLMPMMSSSAELNPLADDHIFHRQRKSFITFENSFCRTHLSNAETWFLLKFSRFCTANIFNQVWKCFPVVSATYYIWNYLVSLHVYFQTSS